MVDHEVAESKDEYLANSANVLENIYKGLVVSPDAQGLVRKLENSFCVNQPPWRTTHVVVKPLHGVCGGPLLNVAVLGSKVESFMTRFSLPIPPTAGLDLHLRKLQSGVG